MLVVHARDLGEREAIERGVRAHEERRGLGPPFAGVDVMKLATEAERTSWRAGFELAESTRDPRRNDRIFLRVRLDARFELGASLEIFRPRPSRDERRHPAGDVSAAPERVRDLLLLVRMRLAFVHAL